MTHLDTLLGHVSKAYLRISQGLLLALVVGILAEVVLRYLLGRGILGSAELTRLVITWIVFLMAFVLYRSRRHIVVTALVDMLDPRARAFCERITDVSVVLLSCYVMLQLWHVWEFLGLRTPVFEIPDTAFKIAPVFCFVPMGLQALVNVLVGNSSAEPEGSEGV
ncbi:TRAP transporter small permease [Vannielia sp. SX4]|uniref:TRAP transporter small permease n=1 Tax=Vannielia sp. SX4 TaxID=3463852 RepID=UPI004057EFC4